MNTALKAVLMLAIIAFTIVGIYKIIQQTPPEPPQDTTRYNYSPLLCDNAFETEKDYDGTWGGNHHDYDNLTHIDVDLQEGCFSGMIKLPHTWTDWRMQLLQKPDSWVSIWYAQNPKAGPIIPLLKFNQDPTTQDWTTTPQAFRLEGKGTLRIFPLNK